MWTLLRTNLFIDLLFWKLDVWMNLLIVLLGSFSISIFLLCVRAQDGAISI